MGYDKGFSEIISHTFYKRFNPEEIESFLAGTSLEKLSFNNIEGEFDQYLETACNELLLKHTNFVLDLAGLRPEPFEEPEQNDPFKVFS